MTTRPNGLQEATALDNFGYYIDSNRVQRAYFGNCNVIDLVNITKNRTAVVKITSAQLLALHATPISIIPAPGVGFFNKVNSWSVRHNAGVAYAGIAGGEDLALKYTDASGVNAAAVIETTGFLDQATAQIRTAGNANSSAAGSATPADITPVENAAIVANLLVGEITTGNFDLYVLVDYDVIPTNFSA